MEIKDNSSPDSPPSPLPRATMESEKEGRDGVIIFIVVLRGRESANRYGEMAFLALLLNENGGVCVCERGRFLALSP